MTCAICLERTPLVEIALVKGCEHQYCGEHPNQPPGWEGSMPHRCLCSGPQPSSLLHTVS